MKITFYRYGSICEPDIISAFHTAGYSMSEYGLEITEKEHTAAELVPLFSRFLMDHPCDMIFSINFFPFVSEIAKIMHIPYVSWTVDSPVMELYTSSITNPYNFTFIFDRADAEELAPLNPGHIFHLPLATNVKDKDSVITGYSEYSKNKKLPAGGNASSFGFPGFEHPDTPGYYGHDITFIGSLYTEKSPYDKLPADAPAYMRGYLDALMESQLLVYGDNFLEKALKDDVVKAFADAHPSFYRPQSEEQRQYLTDRMTLSRLYMGNKIAAMERTSFLKALSDFYPEDTAIFTGSDTSSMPHIKNMGLAKSLTEMPVIFNSSRINLNFTSKSIRTGLPLRIFDILGSGGFCLTNYQSELTDIFTPGEHLDYYGSREELLEKSRYYLDHEKERKEIAVAGYEEVKKKHTWDIRVQEMFALI